MPAGSIFAEGGEDAKKELGELCGSIVDQGVVYAAGVDAAPYLARIAASGRQTVDAVRLLGCLAESEDEYDVEPGAVRAAVTAQQPLRIMLLADEDAAVRQAVSWMVGHTRDTCTALPVVRARLAAETEPAVRAELLTPYGRLDRAGAVAEARALLGPDTPAPLRRAWGSRHALSEAPGRMAVMTDGTTWLADRQSIAFGAITWYLPAGSPRRNSPSVLPRHCGTTRSTSLCRSGDHTGASLLEPHGRLRRRRVAPWLCGDWTYAVAYGGWQAEFGPLTPVSRDGAHVCLLEYEEENGKPVPPQFAYFHDGRLLAAFNLHLDGSWGYERSKATPLQPQDCRSGSRSLASRTRSGTDGRFTARR